MRRFGSFYAVFVMLTMASPLPIAAAEALGACTPNARGTYVCGDGQNAPRIIAGTISPSKVYGVAWRPGPQSNGVTYTREDDGLVYLEDLEAENLLVRLQDGAIMGTLNGTHYGDLGDLNHAHQRIVWSPDSSVLVEVASGKWTLDLLDLRSVDQNGKLSERVSLLGPLRAAGDAALKKASRKAKLDDFALDVLEAPGATLDGEGRLTVPIIMQLIKTDTYFEFDVVFKITAKDSKLSAKVISTKRRPQQN